MPQNSWPWRASGLIHDRGQGRGHRACSSPGVASVTIEGQRS